MLKVHRLDPSDAATAARWDSFVQDCPKATFFHRAGWQRVIGKIFRHDTHHLWVERDGAVAGVLPLAHVRSLLFGKSLTSLPFAVYGGPAAVDAEAQQALVTAARELATRLGVDHLELRNVQPVNPDWPTQSLYVTFRKEISADEQTNMLAIPRKQRAMVRKGIANGLQSVIDPTVERFFDLYSENVHRHGTPAMPVRYFRELRSEFKDDCEVLTVLDRDGRPISSVMSFYFRDEVLPYYAGDHPSARELAGNDFKYWELMRRAVARGIKVFDYGRSKQGTGSYSFKKNWGFEPTPLHYEHCLYKRSEVPQNNPSNAKYQALIRTWRRLPIGIANWLGPFVVRNLG